MIVAMNPRQELREFYPPPYNFLAPGKGCPNCARVRRNVALVNGLARKGVMRGSSGMGQSTSGTISQVASGAGTAVGATSGLLVAAGVLQAVPIAGQIAGAVLAITAVVAQFFKGCGSSCTLTTAEVNQVEPYMQQNLQQYLAAPVSAATQQEALNNFNQLWQGVVNYCSQPSMAKAGQNCISDRQSGSCAYKTTPGGWQQTNGVWTYVYPGANGSGSTCWNWFVGYHDPIANDPRVAEAASAPSSVSAGSPVASVESAVSAITGGLPGWLIPAALIGAGLLFAFGD
jgi:hypothetical protein